MSIPLITHCFPVSVIFSFSPSEEKKKFKSKKMTEEIQCTRPKYLLHEFPENQEHQSSLFVFFFVLNVIILLWKQETILIPPFGWNFPCLIHILVCRGRCLSLRVLHSFLLQRTTIVLMGTFIQIHLLHAPLNRDDCLLARVSYRECMSIGHLMNYAIIMSKEIQNNMLASARVQGLMQL